MKYKRLNINTISRELGSRAVKRSADFLVDNRVLLAPYPSIADYVEAVLDGVPDELNGIDHHLLSLRAEMAKKLWSRGVFIGASILDSLLFSAVSDSAVDNPVDDVLRTIQRRGMHRPRLVV